MNVVVSVIVPTRDRAGLIAETLDSIWRQTYRPIELIIVDDGSADNTRAVFEAWKKDHCGERFEARYVLQDRLSAGAARNRGASLATGSFVQFFDSSLART